MALPRLVRLLERGVGGVALVADARQRSHSCSARMRVRPWGWHLASVRARPQPGNGDQNGALQNQGQG